jgi:hypothetical protein
MEAPAAMYWETTLICRAEAPPSHSPSPSASSRLKRQVVERVLLQCEHADGGDIEPLLILLRRYAAEAAREDARAYCEELVADGRGAGRDRAAA